VVNDVDHDQEWRWSPRDTALIALESGGGMMEEPSSLPLRQPKESDKEARGDKVQRAAETLGITPVSREKGRRQL